jgi:hypothetical protein
VLQLSNMDHSYCNHVLGVFFSVSRGVMSIKMTKQQICEAMKDNMILLDAVTQSKEWGLMPGDSLSVIIGLLSKTDQLWADELTPHQRGLAVTTETA